MEPVAPTAKAVFLSYASQDAAPARRMAERLRAAGVEVWFDQSELRGGEAWDQTIRRRIHECALFVPVISATTQSRTEGYFRREWNLAAARVLDMAKGKPFLLPVAIDGTKETEAVVPDEFLQVQWTRLPAGETPPAFVGRVQGLLGAAVAPKPPALIPSVAPHMPSVELRRDPSPTTPPAPGVSNRNRQRTLALIASSAGLVALIAAGIWLLRPKPAASAGQLRAVPFTANAGLESHPTFSPDGNQVAYSWNGEKQDDVDIYVKLIGAGAPLRLTTDPAQDGWPAWSPNGRWIAFVRKPATSNRGDVILIPALGGPERKIGEITMPFHAWLHSLLAWAGNGQWLVASHAGGGGEAAGLFLLSVESGERRRLTTGASLSPAFSPNGRRLAFVRSAGMSIGELYVCDLTDSFALQGEPVRLTALNQALASPAWTRDGREIVFPAGHHFAQRSLWRIVAAPGNSPRQEPIGEDASTLSMAPYGRRLAYSRRVFDSDLWRLNLRSRIEVAGPPESFIASTRIDSNPAYSPDGKRIVFNSLRSGAEEIWVANADGTHPLQLTTASGPMVADPRWSPDGQTLALHSMRGGVRGLDVIKSSGGAFRRVVDGNVSWPNWSRDGKWIYYGRGSQLWKIPPEGGTAIRVTKQGGTGTAFESTDRKFLFYTKDSRVWRMSLDGGEETRVLDERLSSGQNLAVVEDGLYLVATRDDASPAVLSFFDFATRKLTPLLTISPRWSLGLAVSPDGRSLLYGQAKEESSSLMVVENY